MSHFRRIPLKEHVKQWLCRLFTHIKPRVCDVGSTVLEKFSPVSTSVNKWFFTVKQSITTVLIESLLIFTVYKS